MKKTKVLAILKYVGMLAILFAFLVPIRYVNSLAGYLGALFYVLILIVSFVCLKLEKRGVSVDNNMQDSICLRGEKREASVAIQNKSILIIPKVTAKIYVSDLFGKSDNEEEAAVTLDARSSRGFTFDSAMSHVGIFEVGIRDIVLYDMFGVFKTKLKGRSANKLIVLPRLYEVSDFNEISEAATEEDERGISGSFGMDYVGVREYERGDSMKEIHWKLSAKAEGYYTKLKESNRNTTYRILLDFSAPFTDREELMELNDCLIESSLSVAANIAGQDVEWSFVYFDRSGLMKRRTEIPEDLTEIIADFKHIFHVKEADKNDGSALMAAESEFAVRSSNVIIFTCNINPTFVQDVINLKNQRRMPSLYVIIPERFNSREREKYLAPLTELEDWGISYRVISTKQLSENNGYEGLS